MHVIKNKTLFFSFFLFVLFNIFLYLFSQLFHSSIVFPKDLYRHNYYHFIDDPRIFHKPFDLLKALSPYDSQFYLRIAEQGYLKDPKTLIDKSTYNFFPLFPILIAFIKIFTRNIIIAAFVTSNIFLMLNFFSLYFVIVKWYSQKLATKTIFLFFLFPFSIFFRGYYTESVKLFLLIWFSYFLISKRFQLAAVCLSLLNVTNGATLLLNPVFYGYLVKESTHRSDFWKKALIAVVISLIPFCLWMLFCYIQTGDFVYFYKTRFLWPRPSMFPLLWNLYSLTQINVFPLFARIDIIGVILSGIFLVLSRKFLQPVLWWTTFALWIMPLLVQQATMSYSRFEIVFFPLFIYISGRLSEKNYFFILNCFVCFLLIVSLLFINSYWIE